MYAEFGDASYKIRELGGSHVYMWFSPMVRATFGAQYSLNYMLRPGILPSLS